MLQVADQTVPALRPIWVLGASDPEMATIEQLLTTAGAEVRYAVDETGTRVMPSRAYKAVDVSGDLLDPSRPIHYVECDVLGGAAPAFRADHHRPGDPGFDAPPAGYWQGSSVGQVAGYLGVAPTPALRLVAAADHCLAAAYRGECPGVDPDALMVWRAETRAQFPGRSVDEVMANVQKARDLLATAPRLTFGGERVADMRALERAEHIPELPEAATRDGIAFLGETRDRDGRVKTVLMAASRPAVEAFLAEARRFGNGETYGVPARGFAGVYAEPAPRREARQEPALEVTR